MGKESVCDVRDSGDAGSIPESGRSPGGGNGNPIPVFLPGESHGQGSLVDYNLQGLKAPPGTGLLSYILQGS